MSFEYKIEDNIIIFTFNNGKLNSIPQTTIKGLEEVVDRLNSEEELKGLILTGAGKYFSGGFDLGTFTSFQSDQEIIDWFTYEEQVFYKIFTCSKPVVAAVNGHATAAGMILCMASDYRLAVNSPKIKVGMTEIKIGLALSPIQGEIMRFGLDTDKKFRDVIFSGELISPAQAVEKGIFDGLVENPDHLIEQAKLKVCSMIDTPSRPFISLKYLEKRNAAAIMKKDIDECDMVPLVETFTDKNIINTLKMVKKALGE